MFSTCFRLDDVLLNSLREFIARALFLIRKAKSLIGMAISRDLQNIFLPQNSNKNRKSQK